MRHATDRSLKSLAPLFVKLRAIGALTEKKPGVYYLKSKAFLHFHEDGKSIYADVRINPPEFTRLSATTNEEQASLLQAIREYVE